MRHGTQEKINSTIAKINMFYLSGRGISGNTRSDTEDEFGWYLDAHERIEDRIYNDSRRIVRSPDLNCSVNVVKSLDARETSSLSSTNSCTDSEDPESYVPVQDLTKPENGHDDSVVIEHIEMRSLKNADDLELDLDMIEKDANTVFTSSMRLGEDETEVRDENPRRICYTPERLVRCQEYRILTHSPKFFAIPRSMPTGFDDSGMRRYRCNRRRLGDIIDGVSHLEIFLDPTVPEVRLPVSNRRRLNFRDRATNRKNIEEDVKAGAQDALVVNDRESPIAFRGLDLTNSRSSSERLDKSWEESAKIARPSSQDTSGIHSNDWSTDTSSDIQTPVCLCDELAMASRSFRNATESKNRATAINEVVSILEDLDKNPDRAATLLEENHYCEATSGHDRLTRLALSIEPDGAITPTVTDTEAILIELRDKVERLQETSKDIFKEISGLRTDFEYNENKVDDLIDGAVTLRYNIKEMRYLDDLLFLLDSELERISRRNWPFVFGHSEHRSDDINLVV